MRTKGNVIKDLLNEIHIICKKYDIEYFLTGYPAVLACRGQDIADKNIASADIFMRAQSVRKFISVCIDDLGSDRAIEWMGNCGTFPGLLIRYIDTSTTFYTPSRLICEKKLGMFVNIHILRSNTLFDRCLITIEQAWRNIALEYPSRGKKLEPWIRKWFLKCIKKHGIDTFSARLFQKMLRIYSYKSNANKYWIYSGEENRAKYYSGHFFKKACFVELGEQRVLVANNSESLFKIAYDTTDQQDIENAHLENGVDFFCDTDISYKALKLEAYKENIKDINSRWANKKNKRRGFEKKKRVVMNTFLRTYYRYYFASYLLDHIDEIENLYSNKKYKEIDEFFIAICRSFEKVQGYIYKRKVK